MKMGGSALYGTVFRLSTDGSGFQILAKFDIVNSAMPFGKVALDGDFVYGTTAYGGSYNKGTVFRVAKDGSRAPEVLHSFAGGASDGDRPYGGVVLEGGRSFGTTTTGGASSAGTVFSLNPDGTGFQIVHSFTGEPGGRRPEGTLVAVGEVLYGTTALGGAGIGTVFSVTPDGSVFQVIHEFPASSIDGQNPRCTLVSSDGALFGTTVAGGGGNGNVFEVDLDGSDFTVLHTFTWGPGDGSAPYGSVILDAGTLYGMTLYGGSDEVGVLYRLDASGASFEVLRSFPGGARDGKFPWATPACWAGSSTARPRTAGATPTGRSTR